MKVYRLDFDVNNYRSIRLCEDVNVNYYRMFDGTRVSGIWTIPNVMEYEEDKDLKRGDAPGFNIPVLNKKALDVLLPLIENDVEILPLQFGDEKLYGINVLNIIDAIDYNLSEYLTFRDGKRIMAFKKYVFRENVIKNNNIFKIVDLLRGEVFVSQLFFDYVCDNKLEGFKMELIYESI